jgi:hypothetical protein
VKREDEQRTHQVKDSLHNLLTKSFSSVIAHGSCWERLAHSIKVGEKAGCRGVVVSVCARATRKPCNVRRQKMSPVALEDPRLALENPQSASKIV